MSLSPDNKRAKIDYFSRDCTPITDYLFVSGKKVASDEQKLREKGITHIINCCGDVCENYFPDAFHYLKLHLLDSAQEDIMCVLYKVIDFIDAVRKAKQKVLVHCQQGVSRSTVLVIAYLMYHENSDYDTIYEYVRARRGICRPNVGFMCQLLAWRKRVTKGSSRPHCLYRIGPHNDRDRALVTKWVDRVEVSSLDSRTLFMLQVNSGTEIPPTPAASAASSNGGLNVAASGHSSLHTPTASPTSSSTVPPNILFIWVGMLCPRAHELQYLPYLAHLICKLQALEHAGRHVVVVRQKGREKLERAEALRAAAASGSHPGPSPRVKPTSPSHPSTPFSNAPSVTLASFTPGAPVAQQASFSSELISAAFHTLDSAPAILAATSLNSLYPAASQRETAMFYRILGLEDSDDYTRVGPQCEKPISSAILINEALHEDYPDVVVPDVRELNEVMSRTAPSTPSGNATRGAPGMWLVPPIVQVNKSKQREEISGDGSIISGGDTQAVDVPMEDTEEFAARFNRTPRDTKQNGVGTTTTLRLPKLGGGQPLLSLDDGTEEDTSSPIITIPRKLHLGSASPEASSPRDHSSTPVILNKPKLSLGSLAGLQNGGDDEPMEGEEAGGIQTEPVMSPQNLHTTPLHVDSSAPTILSPAHRHSVLLSPSSLRSPHSAQAASEPWALFCFPSFDNGPIRPYTRGSLTPKSIFLLHHAPSKTLFVWLPPPGQLFIPSKYEGDREAFVGDIQRIFQLATTAAVEKTNIVIAGKETEAFWKGFEHTR